MGLVLSCDFRGWLVVVLYGVAPAAIAGNDVKVNIDAPGTVQNEVRIVDDFFHGTLVTAYNDLIGTTAPTPIGISYSMNGGVNWTDTQLSSTPPDPFGPPGSTFPIIFDPFISFGVPDNVYAGYIATPAGVPPVGCGLASGIFIERSVDGGMTWTGPTLIAADTAGCTGAYRFNDRPTMHVSVFGQVAVAWIKDVGVNQPTSDIYYASSFMPLTPPMPGMPFPPTGLNFSIPVTVNDAPNGTDLANVPDVEIHPQGNAYIAWIDVDVTIPNATTATIKLDKTFEPGPVSFGTDTNVITIDPLPRNLSTLGGSANDARSGSYPVIALDETDVTGQTIYMAYAATPQPAGADEADIYFIKSTNGGALWSMPVRLNDDNTTTDQFHPVIAYQQGGGGGVIVVAWYDKRNCANDNRWDVYMTRSSNGGMTFIPNRLVSDQTFVTPLATSGAPWMGEYMGLALDQGQTAHFAFTSSRNDMRGDVYYDRVPNNAIKRADINNTGSVNIDDLLFVINNWGRCPSCASCPADVAPAPTGNGTVDIDDLLFVINNWGMRTFGDLVIWRFGDFLTR